MFETVCTQLGHLFSVRGVEVKRLGFKESPQYESIKIPLSYRHSLGRGENKRDMIIYCGEFRTQIPKPVEVIDMGNKDITIHLSLPCHNILAANNKEVTFFYALGVMYKYTIKKTNNDEDSDDPITCYTVETMCGMGALATVFFGLGSIRLIRWLFD
jgi:hypothetical protein